MPITATGIYFVAKGATATGTTSLSIDLYAGALDDDIMLMHLTHRGAGFATVPGDWTLIEQEVTAGGVRGEVYWKRASGEVGPYSVTDLADSAVGWIEGFRGCLLSGDPIDVSLASVNASTPFGSNNRCGPITTTVANTMVVVHGSNGTESYSGDTVRVGLATVEAFFNSEPDIAGTQSVGTGSNTTGSDAYLIVRYALKTILGSTINPFYVSGGPNAENIVIVVALKPEVTGSPTSGSRYYLGYGTPGFLAEPWALNGEWADCFLDSRPEYQIARTLELTQYKAGKGLFASSLGGDLTTPIVVTNQQGDYDILWQRFITPPLAAQTLAGTLDCCIAFNARWRNTLGVYSNDAVCRLKIHAYITVGQTPAVRTVLIDNYVNSSDLNNANADLIWENLDAAQSVAGAVSAGDSLVVEIGVRVVSSLTPTPTYPPSEWTEISIIGLGTERAAVAWAADPTAGGTAAVPRTEVAYLDFTDSIVEQALPASPANISPMTATDMGTLPYASDGVNTKGSSANARALWWKFTSTRDGFALFRAAGTNGSANVDVYTGDGASYATLTATTGATTVSTQETSGPRSLAAWVCPVVSGNTYYMRVFCDSARGETSTASGQWVRVAVSYQEAPASGDIFLPANAITAWRDGVCVNWQNELEDFSPSGITIDYTRREMADNNGGTNTNYRLFVGTFGTPGVWIYDLTTLNRAQVEIDSITDPLDLASGRTTTHVAALHMTTAGQLYIQAMGNGFLYLMGVFGGIPADLTDPSDNADVGYVRGIDGTHGDNQAGAPWPLADEFAAAPEVTAPWHGGLHPTSGLLYYGSGGLYFTLPTSAQTAKTFNVASDVQGANFSTETASGVNQGLKGMCVSETNGDVYICNGDEIIRRSSDGVLVETYTPVSDYPVNMIDVRMDPDGEHIWALDGSTSDLFQFSITTAVQTDYVQTWQAVGGSLQIAIFGLVVPQAFAIETEVRPIRRLRQTPHVSANGNRLFHNRLQLDMRVGVGLPSGQGSDPKVMLQVSRDGGMTWGVERFASAGAIGQYLTRVQFYRQGVGRDVVYRIVVSDPVAWQIVGAYLELEEGLN